MTEPNWKRYEEVARKIISQFKSELGVFEIQGNTSLSGKAGTTWKVEGVATCVDGDGFLILECRDYTTKRLNQEAMAGFAYRIEDTGGKGGIIVSPLPLQKGAKIIAEAENIVPVQLESWSTAENYLARILGKTFHGVGFQDGLSMTASITSIELKPGITGDKDP